MPVVITIVLNWNRAEETLACLESLDGLPTRVIVVDNGSTDGSEELLRRRRPDLPILQTGENIGYAGGNNHGIRRAMTDGAEYVWVINNDVRPHHDTLSALLDAMAPGVGCLSTNTEGNLTAKRGPLDSGTPIACDGCDEAFHGADVLIGASLFFRASVFSNVALFDETYFHYFEEADLSYRIARAGFGIGLACQARTDHVSGSSLSDRSAQALYYYARNRIRFHALYGSGGIAAAIWQSPWRAYLAPGRALRHRDGRAVVATALALLDAIRGRFGKRDLARRYRDPLPWRFRGI